MKAQLVYENISFERGKDPRRSMGIGDRDIQLKSDVDDMLIDMGLVEVPISVGPEAHLHDMAQWESIHSLDKKITVVLSRNLDDQYKDKPYMATVYVGNTDDINNISAELTEEDMKVLKYWENAFNNRPVHESISFERGKDPRSAMDVGSITSIKKGLSDLRNDYRINDVWIDHWQGKDCIAVSYDIKEGWNRAYLAVKDHLGMEWFEPGKGKDSNLIGVRNFFILPEYNYLFDVVYEFEEGIKTNESVNFERGRDPKESMGIGITGQEFMENLQRDLEKYGIETFHSNIMDVLNIYVKGMLYFNHWEGSKFFKVSNAAQSRKGVVFRYDQYDEALKYILDSAGINESVNFERGKDPKDSLDIGKDVYKDFGNLWGIARFLTDNFQKYFPGFTDKDVLPRKNASSSSSDFNLAVWKLIERKFGEGKWTIKGTKHDKEAFYADISWRVKKEILKIFKDRLNESVSFKRGADPKTSMGIGGGSEIAKIKKNIRKKYRHILDEHPFGYSFKKWTDKSQGVNRLKISFKTISDTEAEEIHSWMKPYIEGEGYEIDKKPAADSGGRINRRTALKFRIADPYMKMFYHGFYPDSEKTNESVNFERGQEPKKVMKTGLRSDALEISHLTRWYKGFGEKIVPYKFTMEILQWPNRSRRRIETMVVFDDGTESRLDKVINLRKPLIYKDWLFKPNRFGYDSPIKINESVNFERGKDPKNTMRIGTSNWEKLEMGTILLVKKRMGLTSSGRITSGNPYNNILPPQIIILTEPITSYIGEWIIRGNQWDSMESYLKFTKSRKYKNGEKPDYWKTPGYYGWTEFRGKPGTIKNRLEIIDFSAVRESLNEINFKRGQNPKEAMKIGHQAKIREMLDRETYEGRLINLNHYDWDYTYHNVRGYDSFIIHLKDGREGAKYVGVIPGLWVTSYEESPELILDEFEIQLKNTYGI